ncbi:MAG: hypothetical protein D6771_03120 [Zetaproteobacteria bacterium]|nr:MAG: hypothetical protein D6771_03120 [Zetaproteobacteria bacterium]
MAGRSWLNACWISALLVGALASGVAAVPELDRASWKRASALLERGEGPAETLPKEERTVLLAAAALELGDLDRAIRLAEPLAAKDPLAAVIAAEAHRRKALAAAEAAGDYLKPLVPKRVQLAEADLSAGLAEAEAKVARLLDAADGVLGEPVDVLALPEGASVFLVDKARARLFVFVRHQGKLVRVADEYVVTGAKPGPKTREGDGRTPEGVYRFLGAVRDPKLFDRYGPVVFPIDYPNAYDRLHRRNGHGIWLHGYPRHAKRRPPADTRGCFSVPNDRLEKLAQWIAPGRSWVIIGNDLAFDDSPRQTELAASVRAAIEAWRLDWESLDSDRYLAHYDPAFRSGRFDYRAWARYKRRVNATKRFVQVKIEDLAILRDPNPRPEGELVVASFVQHYRSNNYQDTVRKRLFLVRRAPDQPWRILIEEAEPWAKR